MITIFTYTTTLLLLLTCPEDYHLEMGEAREANGTHPILIMEIIEIPSTGTIIQIDGESEIKKAEWNAFKRVVLGTKVNEDDILCLKKETVVDIQFEDGSHVVNKPLREETFITFKRKSP